MLVVVASPRMDIRVLIDPQRNLRSERGTPRFRAHALPSDPCMTGQGRQAGQAADRRKRHSQAVTA